MAQLNIDQQNAVDALKAASGLHFEKGELTQAIAVLEDAWSGLPEPKKIYDESFHLAYYILQMAIQAKDFSKARHWAGLLQECDPERPEIGEREFIAGVVEYEAGELAAAKKLFAEANKKSDGLCFQGEDKKYRQLLKRKDF